MRQALWIRQGEHDPVKVVELTLPSMPRDLCLKYGQSRTGGAAVLVGAFQRLGVNLDGSTVVFEVTDEFSWPSLRGVVRDAQKGFFAVRSDGSGLRRIGDPSREASFAVDWPCILFGGSNCVTTISWGLDFGPDGGQILFADKGPDINGVPAAQMFTLDLATEERTQLTFLPPVPDCSEGSVDPHAECLPIGRLALAWQRFLNAETVGFYRWEQASNIFPYTVDVQTREAKPVQVVPIAGGGLVPVFQITGTPIGFTVFLPDLVPTNGFGPGGNIVAEAFNFNGDNVLQLTAFGRSDTTSTRTMLDGRVVFIASADPLGTNSVHSCEIFSVDGLGGDLRQLTHFGASMTKGCNCQGQCSPPSCVITGNSDVDRGTGSVVFASNCDPFGTNPYGEQLFVMRPDGTGLRQLTFARGLREGTDGSLAVELPGPTAIASPYR